MKRKKKVTLANEYHFKAPAKINHYLTIQNKLPDGKHSLILDFFPISLFDHLTIRGSAKSQPEVIYKHSEGFSSDIVSRLIDAVQHYCNVELRLTVEITKNIPSAAGLGGGSSDAGCLLVVLNRIFELGLAAHELFSIAAMTGSDVPFFLHRHAGIYQHNQDNPLKRFRHMPKDLALVVPDFGASTHDVFNAVAPHKVKKKAHNVDYLSFDYRNWVDHPPEINDFWHPTHPHFETLRRFRDEVLDAGFQAVFLTGTGSVLYGICDDRDRFNNAYIKLVKKPDWNIIRATTMQNYPLTVS